MALILFRNRTFHTKLFLELKRKSIDNITFSAKTDRTPNFCYNGFSYRYCYLYNFSCNVNKFGNKNVSVSFLMQMIFHRYMYSELFNRWCHSICGETIEWQLADRMYISHRINETSAPSGSTSLRWTWNNLHSILRKTASPPRWMRWCSLTEKQKDVIKLYE